MRKPNPYNHKPGVKPGTLKADPKEARRLRLPPSEGGEGLTIAQIAERMNLSFSTVLNYLRMEGLR